MILKTARRIFSLAFAIVFWGTWASADGILFTVTDLGSLTTPLGPNKTQAFGINNSGQVVGWSNGHAFVWTNGVMTDLGTLGADTSQAYDINDHGQVAGWSGSRAFIWDAVNGMVDLGISNIAPPFFGINNSGQVVGAGEAPSGAKSPFLWQNGSTTFLGNLNGICCNEARAINESGQIVGDGFIWQNGVMSALGINSAFDINNAGQAVGYQKVSGKSHAVLWNGFGNILDLGTLGGAESNAYGINGTGQVVGYATIPTGEIHAFLWDAQIGLTDVNPSGWRNTYAQSINDTGQIVGWGTNPNGEEGAFLLTPVQPVPEPGMLVLLVSGLVGVGSFIRKSL
ncbi:MAG: HAF repeat-containing protein [Acidobacteria bacterium]|nr:HAF repeat-containing protein [Acidobacteriota bacterium]